MADQVARGAGGFGGVVQRVVRSSYVSIGGSSVAFNMVGPFAAGGIFTRVDFFHTASSSAIVLVGAAVVSAGRADQSNWNLGRSLVDASDTLFGTLPVFDMDVPSRNLFAFGFDVWAPISGGSVFVLGLLSQPSSMAGVGQLMTVTAIYPAFSMSVPPVEVVDGTEPGDAEGPG